jgi:hypothetical protein
VYAIGLLAPASHLIADSFMQQLTLDAVSPIVAALFGGLVVSLICQRVQNHRAELQQCEERKIAERERRSHISLDMMRVAFAFYRRLIDVTRTEQYDGEDKVSLDELPKHYEEFRISARVLEEQLRVYIPGREARWLWHGAVDMLSVRYYRLVHVGPRLDGMINTVAAHLSDEEIPEIVRLKFLKLEDLALDDRVAFHNKVMKKFEELLELVINVVVHYELEPTEVDPVFLRLGRGSRLPEPVAVDGQEAGKREQGSYYSWA